MKFKLVACEVFTRELSAAAAESEHVIDTVFLPFGLHSSPDDLRLKLQSEIDAAESSHYDAILLGYCLCSRGTAELTARSIPVVIPRAHDCIALFLGSRNRYDTEFTSNPGTYYYSPGWIERGEGDMEQGYITEKKAREKQERLDEYITKYGEDNARFLIEQESLWLANYTRAAFINTQIGTTQAYRDFVKRVASSNGWEYKEIEGDMSLIRKLVNGKWDGDDFVLVKPGERLIETFDERIISSIVSCKR